MWVLRGLENKCLDKKTRLKPNSRDEGAGDGTQVGRQQHEDGVVDEERPAVGVRRLHG